MYLIDRYNDNNEFKLEVWLFFCHDWVQETKTLQIKIITATNKQTNRTCEVGKAIECVYQSLIKVHTRFFWDDTFQIAVGFFLIAIFYHKWNTCEANEYSLPYHHDDCEQNSFN